MNKGYKIIGDRVLIDTYKGREVFNISKERLLAIADDIRRNE